VPAMVTLYATAVAPSGTASGTSTSPVVLSWPSATETSRNWPDAIRVFPAQRLS
jgi:hypothetical protein